MNVWTIFELLYYTNLKKKIYIDSLKKCHNMILENRLDLLSEL